MKDAAQDSTNSDFPKELASPARRALAAAGYTQLTQLAQVSEEHLLNLHGIGPNAIRQLRRALAEKGLSLS
jgi:DNA-directed RNA polymerase alpha subunit